MPRKTITYLKEEAREELKNKIVDMMRKDETLGFSETCNILQISRRTVHSWREKDTEFNQAIKDMLEDTKNLTLDRAEKTIFMKVKEGDEKSSMFYLRSRPESRARGWDFTNVNNKDQSDSNERAEDIALMVNLVNEKIKDGK